MLKSIKAKEAHKAAITLLTFIVEGTKTAGSVFAPLAESEKIAKAEPTFLTIDATVKNEQGDVKVVATQAAIDALVAAGTTSEPVAATPKPEPVTYESIDDLEAIPTIHRGGVRSESYGFDKLLPFPEKPNNFFVPNTEARPNAVKGMTSVVSSANKRYKEAGRKFTVRKFTHPTTGAAGALVVREK